MASDGVQRKAMQPGLRLVAKHKGEEHTAEVVAGGAPIEEGEAHQGHGDQVGVPSAACARRAPAAGARIVRAHTRVPTNAATSTARES